MKNLYQQIVHLSKIHGKIVLAQVIETKGSTPQKAGSMALFSEKGLVLGTIGGGILEGKVQKLACEAAVTGRSGIYSFDLDNDVSNKEEAICGGKAEVLVDAGIGGETAMLEKLNELLVRRSCVTVLTRVAFTGEGLRIGRSISNQESAGSGEEGEVSLFRKNILEDSGFELQEKIIPAPVLVIAGAGHIGRFLCRIGDMLGFDVIVIDDREEYANRDNLPDASDILVGDIGKCLESLDINRDTFIVIVTRGHNDDAKALRSCIGSAAAYVGMIGSRTKVHKMHQSFIENGWATEEEWSRIHAPVGIDINSKTVEEIAISIAAELILVKNRKK